MGGNIQRRDSSFSVHIKSGYLPERERLAILTSIHPFKW